MKHEIVRHFAGNFSRHQPFHPRDGGFFHWGNSREVIVGFGHGHGGGHDANTIGIFFIAGIAVFLLAAILWRKA